MNNNLALNWKKLALFLLLTFGFDWAIAFGYLASGKGFEDSLFHWVGGIYMIIPAVMAVVVQKFLFKQPVKDLGTSFQLNGWYFVAWVLPVVMALGTVLFESMMPGVVYAGTPELLGRKVFYALTTNTLFTLLFAFGEELGWRGFLWNELKQLGFLKACVAVGVIWSLWHAPLILAGYNFPQNPAIGFLLFTVECILLSGLLVFLRIKANSIFAPTICHAAFNGSALLVAAGFSGGSDLLMGQCGLSGIIVLILCCAFLLCIFWQGTFIPRAR